MAPGCDTPPVARRVAGLLAVAGAWAAVLAGAERAAALTCAAPPPGYDPYESHRVVFDAIALSGPAVEFGPLGSLGSPARMLVLRRHRGAVPMVVRVDTAVDLGVGPYVSHMPGFFEPSAGTVDRLFVSRVRRGVYLPNPCAFGAGGPPLPSPLRTVPDSAVRRTAGSRSWHAFAQRGPHGLHCVVLHPVGRHTGGRSECELRRPLLTVLHEGRNGVASTVAAVAGPGIASVELETPDGPLALRPRAPGAPVIAAFSGRVDAAEVRARAVMRDGSVVALRPVGFPTSLSPDPEGRRPWSVALDARRPRVCVGAHQLPPRTGDDDDLQSAYACQRLRRRGYFFRVDRLLAEDEETLRPTGDPVRTTVIGAMSSQVRGIVVRGPDGERALQRGSHGQFLTVYPGSVTPADLTIEVTFTDGSTIVHRGRRRGP